MSQSKEPQGRHLKAGLLASSRLGHRPAGAHLGDASRACQRIASHSASRGRISSTPLVVGWPGICCICCWLEAALARTWQLASSQATWAHTSLHSGLSTLPQRFHASQTCLVPGQGRWCQSGRIMAALQDAEAAIGPALPEMAGPASASNMEHRLGRRSRHEQNSAAGQTHSHTSHTCVSKTFPLPGTELRPLRRSRARAKLRLKKPGSAKAGSKAVAVLKCWPAPSGKGAVQPDQLGRHSSACNIAGRLIWLAQGCQCS